MVVHIYIEEKNDKLSLLANYLKEFVRWSKRCILKANMNKLITEFFFFLYTYLKSLIVFESNLKSRRKKKFALVLVGLIKLIYIHHYYIKSIMLDGNQDGFSFVKGNKETDTACNTQGYFSLI